MLAFENYHSLLCSSLDSISEINFYLQYISAI
jgi:hypothetical protein